MCGTLMIAAVFSVKTLTALSANAWRRCSKPKRVDPNWIITYARISNPYNLLGHGWTVCLVVFSSYAVMPHKRYARRKDLKDFFDAVEAMLVLDVLVWIPTRSSMHSLQVSIQREFSDRVYRTMVFECKLYIIRLQ